MLIAVGILGKSGFQYLKSRIWKILEPSETVTLLRYRLGLMLLFVPMLFIWLHPYLEQAQPGLSELRVSLGLVSAGLVGVSLFVLGGEFWDKLRSLFFYHMKVIQPADQLSVAGHKMTEASALASTPRMLTGGILFVLSLALPVFIPLIKYIALSDEARMVIAGVMVFGIPQLLMVLAVAILGKPGFAYLKQRMGKLFKRLLAAPVSHRRYRLGVLLLVIPLLMGTVWPYLAHVVDAYKYQLAITGDLMLMLALIILGGEFWEKLKSLFVHQTRVANS